MKGFSMSEHNDFYITFCQPQFNKLFDKVDGIHDMLKGKNGDSGVCDDIRDIKAMRLRESQERQKEEDGRQDKAKQTRWLIRTFIAAVIFQGIIIVKEILITFLK